MLIENQVVEMKLNPSNAKHFWELGYEGNYGDVIVANVEHLTKGSHAIIRYECDYCHKEFTKVYKAYINQRQHLAKDACSKCRAQKQKEIHIQTYGVEWPLQRLEVLAKQQQTVIEKYGSNSEKTKMFADKVKATMMERYGAENAMYSPELKEKMQQTFIDKYGVDCPLKLEAIREKVKNTIKERYGTDYYTQTEEYKEKTRETNIEKYGTECVFNSPIVREKIKQTLLELYGVEKPFLSDEIKEKSRLTNIERYGVPCVLQVTEIKAKAMKTLADNGRVPTSSQQIVIYNILFPLYDNIELNHSVSTVAIDIALFLDKLKLAIEYDSAYWHYNQQRDRRRDEHLKTQGWKILRIKSGHKLPTLEQLQEAIDKLVTTDRTYTEIVLDDWKLSSTNASTRDGHEERVE